MLDESLDREGARNGPKGDDEMVVVELGLLTVRGSEPENPPVWFACDDPDQDQLGVLQIVPQWDDDVPQLGEAPAAPGSSGV